MNATAMGLQKFRALCEEVSTMLEKEGWSVRPYALESLPYFQQLSAAEQVQATELLSQYVDICRTVYSAGRRIKDMPFLVQTALKYYGFEVSQGVLDQLENVKGRIVEFYSPNHTQFFRSFNFFEFCSYTIEDIFCRAWISLYSREEEVALRLLEQVNYVLSGKVSHPVIITEVQKLQERVSLERLQVYMTRIYMEPLVKDGNVEGLIAIEDCAWGVNEYHI